MRIPATPPPNSNSGCWNPLLKETDSQGEPQNHDKRNVAFRDLKSASSNVGFQLFGVILELRNRPTRLTTLIRTLIDRAATADDIFV